MSLLDILLAEDDTERFDSEVARLALEDNEAAANELMDAIIDDKQVCDYLDEMYSVVHALERMSTSSFYPALSSRLHELEERASYMLDIINRRLLLSQGDVHDGTAFVEAVRGYASPSGRDILVQAVERLLAEGRPAEDKGRAWRKRLESSKSG